MFAHVLDCRDYWREFFRAGLLECDGGRQSPVEKTSRRQ